MFSSIFKDPPSSSSSSSSSRQASASKDGESLDTILPTPALRTELALLVVLSTDAMRKDIDAAFQVPPELASAASFHDPHAEEDLITVDDSQKTHTAKAAKSAERAQKIRRELTLPETQKLWDEALTFYKSWRTQVLKRVGEVLHVRSEAVRRAKEERAAKEKRGQAEADLLSLDMQQDSTSPTSSPGPSPIPTALTQLDEPSRTLILHSILLLLLSLQNYPAHSRILLQYISTSLNLPRGLLATQESVVATALLTSASQHISAEEETARAAQSNSAARKWKVGLATVAGAALIGVTGGLAAPFLAAGIGTVMGGLGLGATAVGGLLGGLAGSSVLVGGLFGAYGGRMTGKMMDRYARDVSDFRFIAVREERERIRDTKRQLYGTADEDGQAEAAAGHRLRVAIAVSGWLTEEEDLTKPWRVLGTNLETFALRYEVEALLKLGTSLSAVLKSAAWSYARLELVRRTILGSLAAGLWPIMLLRVGKVVDNPFSIAKARSDKAGAVLADALINKAQGERPVTLIGYSLGARVIYTCLQTLAARRAFGLVETVVLMGAPTPSDAAAWRRIRSVVTGRVVNVYSSNDHILGFLYRTSSIQLGVAGLERAEGVQGIENVDVSDLVDGHNRYRWLTGTILKRIGMEDLDEIEVLREEEELRYEEEKDEKTKKEQEEKVAERMERSGDEGEEGRRIIMEDVVEEEAKLLEMRTGTEPQRSVERKSSSGHKACERSIESLSIHDTPTEEDVPPQMPLRPPTIRRKPVGEQEKLPDPAQLPPKSLRPEEAPKAAIDEVEETQPPLPPKIAQTDAPKEEAPKEEAPKEEAPKEEAPKEAPSSERTEHAGAGDKDHEDYESFGDVESVRTASPSEMMFVAPEAEPESDPEPEPAPKFQSRRQDMYSALD